LKRRDLGALRAGIGCRHHLSSHSLNMPRSFGKTLLGEHLGVVRREVLAHVAEPR